ncbi:MAG: hypothetical protein IPO22_02605 [Anaerolineales bacterium]|nr:hypothetical protein [Anaerolineales bacterium]
MLVLILAQSLAADGGTSRKAPTADSHDPPVAFDSRSYIRIAEVSGPR